MNSLPEYFKMQISKIPGVTKCFFLIRRSCRYSSASSLGNKKAALTSGPLF